MKKIFLLLFLLTCLLSFNFANAGVNETGSSSISLECKKTMLKKYQSDLSVSKSEGKNFFHHTLARPDKKQPNLIDLVIQV